MASLVDDVHFLRYLDCKFMVLGHHLECAATSATSDNPKRGSPEGLNAYNLPGRHPPLLLVIMSVLH